MDPGLVGAGLIADAKVATPPSREGIKPSPTWRVDGFPFTAVCEGLLTIGALTPIPLGERRGTQSGDLLFRALVG